MPLNSNDNLMTVPFVSVLVFVPEIIAVPPFILPAHAAVSGLLPQQGVKYSVSHPEDK